MLLVVIYVFHKKSAEISDGQSSGSFSFISAEQAIQQKRDKLCIQVLIPMTKNAHGFETMGGYFY